jgi:hypothetical protein
LAATTGISLWLRRFAQQTLRQRTGKGQLADPLSPKKKQGMRQLRPVPVELLPE